jgi:uncharacterized protein
MPNPAGSFIWYEYAANDVDAAKTFYEAVVGWNVGTETGTPGIDYRMINAGDGQVGGMMGITDDMKAGGARPIWLAYLAVDDTDAKAEEIKAAGGSVLVPPSDIPNVGRFAMFGDPDGVPFYILKPIPPEPNATSNVFSETEMGRCSWNELVAGDQDKSLAFYGGLFGWEKNGTMPMGEMGDYTFIALQGLQLGAMMNKPNPGPQPGWTFYFRVPDVDAAIPVIEAQGGKVLNGPHDVPGDQRIVIASDPAGATFGLVARK